MSNAVESNALEVVVWHELWTVNDEHSGAFNRWRRGALIASVREVVCRETQQRKLAPLVDLPVVVIATPLCPELRADAGAHLPVQKAAVDGLVDAGLLPGDQPRHVSDVVMRAPVRRPREGMQLLIVPSETFWRG